jgi:hypothetical protein
MRSIGAGFRMEIEAQQTGSVARRGAIRYRSGATPMGARTVAEWAIVAVQEIEAE